MKPWVERRAEDMRVRHYVSRWRLPLDPLTAEEIEDLRFRLFLAEVGLVPSPQSSWALIKSAIAANAI